MLLAFYKETLMKTPSCTAWSNDATCVGVKGCLVCFYSLLTVDSPRPIPSMNDKQSFIRCTRHDVTIGFTSSKRKDLDHEIAFVARKFFYSLRTHSDALCEAHHALKMPRQREILEHHTRGQQSFLLHQISTTTSLLVELALVESELLTLQDVTVAATGLARSAGDDGEQSTGLELLLDGALNLAAGGVTGSLLLLDRVGLLDLLLGLALLGSLGLLASSADGLAVVGLVPLSEGGGVDLDDGALGQGVGSDQLVVGGVVGDTDDTGLAGAALGAPGEVAGVETEGTVLVVTTTSSDGVDALGANTGVGTLATSLESALLPCCQRSERMSKKRSIRAFGIITHGSRRAWHRRRSACVESHARYP